MSLDVYLYGEDPVFEQNITHNLIKMAAEAGIYDALWRPDERFAVDGVVRGSAILPALRAGLATLVAQPERFKALNPSNGWGSYEGLVKFVREYIEAIEERFMLGEDPKVKVSR